MALTQLSDILPKLEAAGVLPNARTFTSEESKAIESVLNAYAEKDGTVTSELVYFAVQSQVLCKLSYEAAVMLRIMKFFCCVFAFFMGFLAIVLQTIGLGLGFVYMSMGIFVGPAVAPATLAILMEKASAQACTFGAIAGLCGGLITWVACAQIIYGKIEIGTLGGDYPFLCRTS